MIKTEKITTYDVLFVKPLDCLQRQKRHLHLITKGTTVKAAAIHTPTKSALSQRRSSLQKYPNAEVRQE